MIDYRCTQGECNARQAPKQKQMHHLTKLADANKGLEGGVEGRGRETTRDL